MVFDGRKVSPIASTTALVDSGNDSENELILLTIIITQKSDSYNSTSPAAVLFESDIVDMVRTFL